MAIIRNISITLLDENRMSYKQLTFVQFALLRRLEGVFEEGAVKWER